MRLVFRIFIAFIILLLFGMSLSAQQQMPSYRSFMIDSFDTPGEEIEWIVRGSRETAEGFPRLAYVENWPTALHGYNKEERDLRVLGVEAAFTQRGYNYIEILPAQRLQDGTVAAVPYRLPATTSSIDMWVWGSNYNYTIEIHLRDFRGLVHTVRVGETHFHGWKNMSAYLPTGLRTLHPHDVLNSSGIELMKIILWTRPTEYSRNFFVYFDDLKAVSDGYSPVTDGGRLADPDLRQDLWDDAITR